MSALNCPSNIPANIRDLARKLCRRAQTEPNRAIQLALVDAAQEPDSLVTLAALRALRDQNLIYPEVQVKMPGIMNYWEQQPSFSSTTPRNIQSKVDDIPGRPQPFDCKADLAEVETITP